VPKLPPKFQTTEQIEELTRLVLSTSARDMSMCRVGFWGMGGIGKTVTGAAIVRDEGVRLHFDAIVWLPLGQTPVISKLQNLCHMQCTGKELSPELSSEEKQEALQQAMKGKRVLLCLDDLWEEEHELELNFVDESAGSKVLISTRMKALLSGGHQVEVGLPSSSDSCRMLLAAADADVGGRQPSGVSEIVDLCGRLPLALGIAGRLAAVLGLVGTDDWSGMIGVLKEELRESHSGGAEEGMIRASLRGLKGSAQEQANVRSLLLMFALVPEDTHCPLDVMLLMFNAVHEGSGATMMHVRKWLRTLINRSLVLGTIDRPSVHDLVLDFAVAQHGAAVLREAHRRVVEAFRAARPVDVHGRRMYENARIETPIAAYVCNEIQYHIAHGWEDDMEHDVIATQEWLTDVPQDVVVVAAGCNLGVEKLSSLASAAELAQDWWLAARYFQLVRTVMFEQGGMSPAMSDPLNSCLASFDRLRDSDSSPVPLVLREQQELVHFSAVVGITQLLNAEVMTARAAEFEQALQTTAATRDVAATVGVRWLNTCVVPNAEHWRKEYLAIALMMRDAAESHADPHTRSMCAIARVNYPQNVNALCMCEGWDWEIYLGKDGAAFREAMECYEFSVHHNYLIENFNGDWLHALLGVAPYTVHLGDFDTSLQMVDKQLETMAKSIELAAQGEFQELLGLMIGSAVWTSQCCTLEFPRGAEFAGLMDAHGHDWQHTDAAVDRVAAAIPWMRDRGETAMNTGTLSTAEMTSWMIKLGYFLHSPPARSGVSEEQVLAVLPTVDDVGIMSMTFDDFSCIHEGTGQCDTFLFCARVCEKCGQHARALTYAEASIDHPRTKGSTTLPQTQVPIQQLRGRCLVALGRQGDALEAFTAAAELAHKHGLFFLEVLALRDFKLHLLDAIGHGEHASQRLGQALRRLRNPESMTQLLHGLSAEQLVALADPDPSYQASFDDDVSSGGGGGAGQVAELEASLEAMRMSALQKRAKAAGISDDQVDDAMESKQPKKALIALLLSQ
jgi:tetratricopeptide (TPR) repeat protein